MTTGAAKTDTTLPSQGIDAYNFANVNPGKAIGKAIGNVAKFKAKTGAIAAAKTGEAAEEKLKNLPSTIKNLEKISALSSKQFPSSSITDTKTFIPLSTLGPAKPRIGGSHQRNPVTGRMETRPGYEQEKQRAREWNAARQEQHFVQAAGHDGPIGTSSTQMYIPGEKRRKAAAGKGRGARTTIPEARKQAAALQGAAARNRQTARNLSRAVRPRKKTSLSTNPL